MGARIARAHVPLVKNKFFPIKNEIFSHFRFENFHFRSRASLVMQKSLTSAILFMQISKCCNLIGREHF